MRIRIFKPHGTKLLFKVICLLVIAFNLSCEKDISEPVEAQQEKKVKRIDFETFSQSVNTGDTYHLMEDYFDFNVTPNNDIQSRTLDATSDITILTDEIVSITEGDTVFYTFKVVTTTVENEFYNLIVSADGQGEIIGSMFLKYTPSTAWLSDMAQPFTGFVKLINNDFLSVDGLLGARTAWNCVTGVNYGRDCEDDASPSQNDFGDGCTYCTCDYYAYLVTSPCPGSVVPDEGFEVTEDAPEGGQGGGPGVDSSPTIPLRPCLGTGDDVSGDGNCYEPSTTDSIIDCINTNTPNDGILLNDEQLAFLDSRSDEDNLELWEILQDGLCSTASQELVSLAIDGLMNDCNTTTEDLQDVFPNTSEDRLEEIADAINEHAQDFGVDTKEKLQHFLAQAGHESANFVNFRENLNYRVNRLGINYWTSKFNPYTSYTVPPTTTIDSTKQNPNDYASSTSTVFVDHELFANFVYDDANRSPNYRLGNTQVGDGYLFRGRGIFQLTGRTNYTNFNNYYQENINEDTDLVANPDLVATDMEIAVISALWFYQENILDEIDVDEDTTVREVTEVVNGGTNGLEDREEIFEECEEHIDCVD